MAQPVHKSLVMFDKPEYMNTQNEALIAVAAKDFKAEVLESTQPVLVEFWAPWSRPCQVFDAVLRDLASACAELEKRLEDPRPEHWELACERVGTLMTEFLACAGRVVSPALG